MKKWKPMWKASLRWWASLTTEQKKAARVNYQKVYDNQHNKPFPSLKAIEGTRNKILTEHQINSIWRFRDYKH